MEIESMLKRAITHQRITRQDWEIVLATATEPVEVVLDGENRDLHQLVSLLEAGLVEVEGVPYHDVLRSLAAFI